MRYLVQTDRRRLLVFAEDALVAEFPVAVGRPDSASVKGDWHIRSLGPLPNDPDVLAELDTPRMVCIRRTDRVESLGHAASGG